MSTKIKYVFSISHPMQYLNALEACHARNLPPEECAVLFFNKPFGTQIDQLKSIVNPHDWGHVQYVAYPNYWIAPGKGRTFCGKMKVAWSKVFSARSFHRELVEFANTKCELPLELAATGNYLSRPHRHFLAIAEQLFGAKEIMLLDEGTALPNFIVPLRHNPNDPKSKRFNYRFTRRDITGRILRVISGLKFSHPKAATLFTIYDDIQPPASDKVETNTLDRVRKLLKEFRKTDEVWFLGTCYVEHNYAYADKYLEVLKAAKMKFVGKTLYYFPHRYESENNLQKIADLGFTIKRPDMAIEPWIVTNKKMPAAIAAVATSAIDNISHMFKGAIPIHIFRPGPELFIGGKLEKAVYDIIDGHKKNGHNAVTVYQVDFK